MAVVGRVGIRGGACSSVSMFSFCLLFRNQVSVACVLTGLSLFCL